MDTSIKDLLLQTLSVLIEFGWNDDKGKIKTVENICKESEEWTVILYEEIHRVFESRNSQKRLRALQLCVEFFDKSHAFRTCFIRNMKYILRQTLFGSKSHPIPKPKDFGDKMRKLIIKSINLWHQKFAIAYPVLSFTYKYLKKCKDVDFERGDIITASQREKILRAERKELAKYNRRIKKVKNEMTSYMEQMLLSVKEFSSAFKLMIPDVDNFLCSEIKESEDCDMNIHYGSDFIQKHGITKTTDIKIDLRDISKIHETSDNDIIIKVLRDQFRIMKKSYIPRVRVWEQLMLPYSSTDPDLMKEVIDIKGQLEKCVEKFSSLTIISHESSSEDDDDDDLIEVPLSCEDDDFELMQLGLNISKSHPISERDLLEAGPSGIKKTITTEIPQEIHDKKQFIEDFDSENFDVPTKSFNSAIAENPIWGTNEVLHELDNVKNSQTFGSVVVDVKSNFEPVKLSCRAPLPSGRLCPRKDRKICPLHGPIVPRNLGGEPSRLEDRLREQERKDVYERDHPEWQNPVLLAEIKAQTGIDLDVKKAKSRKRKHDGSSTNSTARDRLSKKLFKKRSK